MRTFKLIKEYPGSPVLGTINGFATNVTLGLNIVVDQPEYWEELIEKTYEIIEYQGRSTGYIYKLDQDGIYKSSIYKITVTGDEILKSYDIYSIKRLSDGKIFTVNDNVQLEHDRGFCLPLTTPKQKCVIDRQTTVLGFKIINGEIGIQIDYNKLHYSLDAPEKVEQKRSLFTTEDGVIIFEGDDYFKVLTTSYIIMNMINADASHNINPITFSTREKAEEYVLMNKKLLSIDDVLEVWSALSGNTKDSLMSRSTLMSRIIEFVKLN